MNPGRPSTEVRDALAGCWPYFAAAGLFSGAVNLLFLSPSLYMIQVYDRVLNSGSQYTLVMLTLAVALALGTMAALDAVRARVLVRCGIAFDNRLSARVLSALIDRGLVAGSERHREALRDLDNFRQVATGAGIHALFDAPWVPIYLAVMFLLSLWFGVMTVLAAAVLLLLAVLNDMGTRAALGAANDSAVRSYRFTEVAMRNAEVIQAMGMMPGVLQRWQLDRQALLGWQARASDRAADWGAVIKFVRLFMQSFALALGAWLVLDRQVTPGAMFAAAVLLGRALAPVELAVGAWKNLASARQSYGRVRDLLAQFPAPMQTMALPAPSGRLSLDQVVSVPPGGDRAVLKGISLEIAAGEGLGIIGPSAAGKSSLLRLLVGVWKPVAGQVRLDGADVATWDRVAFGRAVGYLPQDIELFAGTVRDNIARFTEAQPEAVIDAAQRAGVHDMILRLARGYDTEIGPGGSMLSGGQRQRLGLARALFGRPRLLVLDEPNANLDSDGEAALIETLEQVKQEGTTLIIVAHRTTVLNVVDRLMVLRDGAVELLGPRAEVLATLSGKVVRPAAFAGGAPKEGA